MEESMMSTFYADFFLGDVLLQIRLKSTRIPLLTSQPPMIALEKFLPDLLSEFPLASKAMVG
jgi:hypothetical protein